MQILEIATPVTAYGLVKSNTFPYKKIGNQYKIPVVTFNEWLNDGSTPKNKG